MLPSQSGHTASNTCLAILVPTFRPAGAVTGMPQDITYHEDTDPRKLGLVLTAQWNWCLAILSWSLSSSHPAKGSYGVYRNLRRPTCRPTVRLDMSSAVATSFYLFGDITSSVLCKEQPHLCLRSAVVPEACTFSPAAWPLRATCASPCTRMAKTGRYTLFLLSMPTLITLVSNWLLYARHGLSLPLI